MVAMDEWEAEVACDRCADRGCVKCDPQMCTCGRLLEYVEDHADCLDTWP